MELRNQALEREIQFHGSYINGVASAIEDNQDAHFQGPSERQSTYEACYLDFKKNHVDTSRIKFTLSAKLHDVPA